MLVGLFITWKEYEIFGNVTDDRLNAWAINLSLPQRLHFKVSIWAAFACNARFSRFHYPSRIEMKAMVRKNKLLSKQFRCVAIV